MFSFVARKLNFLKSIPLFALVFDSLLKMWMLMACPERLDQIDEIENEVLTWGNTTSSLHKFGGPQFNYKETEFAHIHSNGLLDILFTQKIKAELMLAGKIEQHHIFGKSGWISFYIQEPEDIDYALFLLKLSYQRMAGIPVAINTAILPLSTIAG